MTKSDAKKSAALLSLMNSIFNEHPLRKISEEFIKKSIDTAQNDFVKFIVISFIILTLFTIELISLINN